MHHMQGVRLLSSPMAIFIPLSVCSSEFCYKLQRNRHVQPHAHLPPQGLRFAPAEAALRIAPGQGQCLEQPGRRAGGGQNRPGAGQTLELDIVDRGDRLGVEERDRQRVECREDRQHRDREGEDGIVAMLTHFAEAKDALLPESGAGEDEEQPCLSAASANVPLRSVDGPASPPSVALSSPPAPATEFSQRAPAPGGLEAGVPDSWRSRDRESRRICRGECGAYVFTGAADPSPTRKPLPPARPPALSLTP